MPRGRAVIALLAVSLATAGCELIGGPQITCLNVDAITCERMAADLLEETRRDEPDKRVVSLTIKGSGGQYDMKFSDGTGKAVVGH